MCLSFVRLTRFLARLMARPRVTLLTSNTLSMVCSNVNRSTRLWVAFGKNYARKPRQPYFVWCFRVFFLMAFHTLSLLHFPLPHFQRPRASIETTAICIDCTLVKVVKLFIVSFFIYLSILLLYRTKIIIKYAHMSYYFPFVSNYEILRPCLFLSHICYAYATYVYQQRVCPSWCPTHAVLSQNYVTQDRAGFTVRQHRNSGFLVDYTNFNNTGHRETALQTRLRLVRTVKMQICDQ